MLGCVRVFWGVLCKGEWGSMRCVATPSIIPRMVRRDVYTSLRLMRGLVSSRQRSNRSGS